MFKSPVRNQRSKGIRVKHVLQVCFLLAICFWLIYQVKHSHDKKKALLETDAKQSTRTEPTGDILKLGRKDPILKEEKPESNNGKLNEEVEDEEIIGNDEENKNEEAVEEEETGDKDDEGGEDEVDEIDEHELEKTEEEVDRDEEVTEEEKGEEEKENKDKDGEDSNDSIENENSSKEHDDVEDEATEEKEETTHEAREENYKADDASSAVTQTSQGVEKSGKDSLRDENLVNNTNSLETTASSTGGREIAEIDVPLNTATNEAVEEVSEKSKNGLSENTASDHLSIENGTETEADGTLLKNVTLEDITSKVVSEETTDLNQVKNSILSSRNNESHDAGSGSDTTVKNSINLQSSDIKSNINNEAKPNTVDAGPLLTMDDVTQSSENVDDAHNDPIDSSDSSISLEEKNDEKHIEMLANFALNKDGNEDAAAE